MVRAMGFRSDRSGFCALQPCFKTAIMPFLLPLFLPSYIQLHAVVLLATSCLEPLAQEDQFYQYQKVCIIVVVSLRQSQLMTVNSPKDFPFISLTSLQFLVLRARVNTFAILSFIKN